MQQFQSSSERLLSDKGSPANGAAEIWAFPRDQAAWRINWFGDVSFPDRTSRRQQPSVLVHLSRVIDSQALNDTALLLDPQSTNHAWFSCMRNVSVGTLPYMRIGDIWRNGQLILQPDYKIEQFPTVRVDSSTTVLVKAGLNKDGRGFLLPLAEHPWHRLCTQSYCIEVSLGNGRRLIIPCMELIRFYFGSSSNLVSKLFLPGLSKKDLYSDAQYDNANGLLTIKLAEKISGASASDIGRLCLNAQAWRSAVAVGISLHKASLARQPVFPQAFFPFEGVTDLVAAGKWVSFSGTENSTFVVFNLRSCSHPFPFSSLRYELQRPRGYTGNSDPITQPALCTRGPDPNRQTLVERDASNKLAEKTERVRFEHRFPDLTKKSVWKYQESQGTETALAFIEGKGIGASNAAVGNPGSNQHIRPMNLEITSPEERRPPLFLRQVVEELEKLDGVDFSLITPHGDDGWTVPIRHRYKNDRHLYIEMGGGRKRLRRIGGFRLGLHNRYIYLALIEAEPARPFFIKMSETAEDRFIPIAAHNFMLWQSKKYPDSDPMGFRSAIGLFGASLRPLVEFFESSLAGIPAAKSSPLLSHR